MLSRVKFSELIEFQLFLPPIINLKNIYNGLKKYNSPLKPEVDLASSDKFTYR